MDTLTIVIIGGGIAGVIVLIVVALVVFVVCSKRRSKDSRVAMDDLETGLVKSSEAAGTTNNLAPGVIPPSQGSANQLDALSKHPEEQAAKEHEQQHHHQPAETQPSLERVTVVEPFTSEEEKPTPFSTGTLEVQDVNDDELQADLEEPGQKKKKKKQGKKKKKKDHDAAEDAEDAE